ncbi:MAG: hypothetical protein JW731_04495 [Bacteroidales bacterium]|nr:hypothetical protein [Bacteroidales bacterium]
MQLLRTILIIVLVYYLVKLIARYVLPLIVRYFIRKAQNDIQAREGKRKKQGEMNIEYSPDKKQATDKLGEYVDYEEVKD